MIFLILVVSWCFRVTVFGLKSWTTACAFGLKSEVPACAFGVNTEEEGIWSR
jgi:hypothetical protein